MSASVAIAGATGEVGRALLDMLETAELPLADLRVLASERSEEETLMFGGRPLLVEPLRDFDFSAVQIVVLALPAELAQEVGEQALAAGCRVIDHSTAWQDDLSTPLVMAGADEAQLQCPLLRCPGAPAAMLAPVLNGLDEEFGIESVQLTLLLPVSTQGRAGVRELARQTGELLNARGIEPAVFPARIAFNCLPVIEQTSGGLAAEERRLERDLDRLLYRPLPVAFSLMVVPVFYGQSASLCLQTSVPADLTQAVAALRRAGVIFMENESDQGVVTSVTDVAGQDGVYIAAVAPLPSPLQGLRLWLMADNVRQGAAQHSFYVLKKWIKDF